MKNKTILGMWCTNSNCKFIDKKHIQIESTVNIWYSYDNDSKTDVITKEICFVKEIDFNELNDKTEILEEEKKIPEKIPEEIIVGKKQPTHRIKKIKKKVNEIISYLDYLKSKGE